MQFARLVLAAALAATLAVAPVQAQTRTPAAAAGGEAWYQQQITDLAEVLGGAHYLRITCGGRGDQRWRDYMRGMIDREPAMRQPLSDAFNDGYRNESARFPECDQTARQVEAELRARGLRIAGALGARNGD